MSAPDRDDQSTEVDAPSELEELITSFGAAINAVVESAAAFASGDEQHGEALVIEAFLRLRRVAAQPEQSNPTEPSPTSAWRVLEIHQASAGLMLSFVLGLAARTSRRWRVAAIKLLQNMVQHEAWRAALMDGGATEEKFRNLPLECKVQLVFQEGLLSKTVPLPGLRRDAAERFQEEMRRIGNSIANHGARILVLGYAGAGKSSCINAAFKGNRAPTGPGRAITRDITYYQRTDECPIHIYDAPGFEPGPSTEEVMERLRNFQRERQAAAAAFPKGSADWVNAHIGAIWWVVDPGSRYNPEYILEVSQIFDGHVPIIVVLNKTDCEADIVNFVKQQIEESCLFLHTEVQCVVADAQGGPPKLQCEQCNTPDISINRSRGTYICEACGEREVPFRGSYGFEAVVAYTAHCLPDMVSASIYAAQTAELEVADRNALWLVGSCAAGAAIVGFVPLSAFVPTRFALLPGQVAMGAALAVFYKVRVSRATLKDIVISMGGFVGFTVGGLTVARFLRLVPVLGSVIQVTDAMVAGTVTYAVGRVLMEIFARLHGIDPLGDLTQDHVTMVMSAAEMRKLFMNHLQWYARRSCSGPFNHAPGALAITRGP